MKYFNDNAQLDLTCPGCGHRIKQRMGSMTRTSGFQCPTCHTRFDSRQFTRDMRQVERKLDDLARQIRRLGR